MSDETPIEPDFRVVTRSSPRAAVVVGEDDLPFESSPLTDIRALSLALVVHAVMLALASLLALSVAVTPDETRRPLSIRGEFDPTDNRESVEERPAGGAPGEQGGEAVRLSSDASQASPVTATKDPAADALLSEILPTGANDNKVAPEALPGPSTSGLGLFPGPGGGGGGGGSGGGSGGGEGPGIGPGTAFFGMSDRARSFAYVIDCSGSMTNRNSLQVAKNELLASLGQLPDSAEFSVVFYNLSATVFDDAQGRKGLMPATANNKARVRTLLATIVPDGGTDHMLALRTALELKPEVIFFLTDADLMTRQDVEEIVRKSGKTRIQAVEFGLGGGLNTSVPLRDLAKSTGGFYRYIDVRSFGAKN